MGWDRRTVETPGGPFAVAEAGSGTPLIYLHDEIAVGPSPLADSLSRSHRVIAPVHPGFWGADRPEWVESVRDVVEHYMDLFAALDLGDEGVTLVGSSMGGWIAVELAFRLPRVRGVAVLNPLGIHVPGHAAADYWYVREREEVLFNDLSAMPSMSPDEQVANEESAARYGWSPRLYDPSLAPRLHRLDQPVLIVWGAEDRLLPREHLGRWQELLPHAEVVEIADAGHFPTYERPDDTAAAIAKFLTDLPAEQGAA